MIFETAHPKLHKYRFNKTYVNNVAAYYVILRDGDKDSENSEGGEDADPGSPLNAAIFKGIYEEDSDG